MSTEVLLAEFQELPGDPNVQIVIDTNRKAQVRVAGVNVAKAAYSATASASRDLVTADIDNVVTASGASPVVLTIPTDAVLGNLDASARPAFVAYQSGTGALSFAALGGVTLVGTPKTAAQYLTQGIVHVGANTWAYL